MSDVRVSEIIGPAYKELAHDALIDHKYTHYSMSGGRGSLKSSAVSILVPIIIVKHPDVHGCVFRKVGNTIRDSVFAQYLWGIDKLGWSAYWDARTSPPELTYRPTGQKILFRGADDPMKIKSIKVPFGYIGVTQFEELDQFSGRKEIRTILQSTMRGGAEFWNFETFNPPISRDNWANLDSLQQRPDRMTLKTTYLQAPEEWLGAQFLMEAEYLKQQDEKAWRHEYMGEAVGTGGSVFENLKNETITDQQIGRFDRVYNGVDWGFFPDPWAFNRVYYNAARRTLYIFDELETVKKGNHETAEMLKKHGITSNEWIIADSAEPKSVADYKHLGLTCFPAKKGPGSVEYSMKWLQSLSAIVIDAARCPRTWKEFSGYEYERTRDGEIVSGYPDKDNHHIDAVRYATENIWKRGEKRR